MKTDKDIKRIITPEEYIRAKALRFLGLIDTNINPQAQGERLQFVNNIDDVKKMKLKEYNVWYSGDSDEILNFYTRANTVEYNEEPFYDRNKRSYFWAVASTENDIKRTHSGQPRNIIDTMVNLVGIPHISYNDEKINERLQKVLEDNNFELMIMQEQLPMTLVEGWGCFKINYDKSLRDTPIILYYRADSVDFIYKSGQLIAIIFKDYYQNANGENYVLFETRRLERDKHTKLSKLVIEKDVYKMNKTNILSPCELTDIPELRDVAPVLEIKNYDGFLAVPSIIYKDNNNDWYGRSVYTGKIDLFDDLDQSLSQQSTTVRRSTVHEYYNSNYLERDENSGMPIQPNSFDRKYILYNGGADANGSTTGQLPVLVTQPNLNIDQYSSSAQATLLEMITGYMSPATLGIDIAKRDNAEAQREKEKVTIFTRNTIIKEMFKSYSKLCNELMCCQELMDQGKITVHKYEGLNVQFDEFANGSMESRIEALIALYNSGVMTPDLFIDMLYRDELSEEKKQIEKDFINQALLAQQQAMQSQAEAGQPSEEELGMLGALLGGNPDEMAG